MLDENGEATGELREFDAMGKIKCLLPQPDKEEKHRLLNKGLNYASSLGITSIHNMNGDPPLAALLADCERS